MEKKIYSSPIIELVQLDNEISLALASAPPAGPSEVLNAIPAHFSNDPFNGNNA